MNLGLALAIFLYVLYGPLSETAKIICIVLAILDLLGGLAWGPRWPVVVWNRKPA